MFPHISGLEWLPFSKVWHWDLAIATEAIIFYFGQLWILIQNINSLVNTWQRSFEWYKILNSLHYHKELKLNQKRLGKPLRKWLISSQLSVHELPIICFFLLLEHIHFFCRNTSIKEKLTILSCYHQKTHSWKLIK